MKKIRRRGAIAVLISLLLGAPTLATAPSASANSIVSSRVVNGVRINLWYNNGWNWLSVEPLLFANAGGEAGIYSASSGWRWTPSYARLPSRTTTGAVWAPGSTCVTISANIVDNTRVWNNRVQQTWVVC